MGPYSVASYDTQGDVGDIFLPGSPWVCLYWEKSLNIFSRASEPEKYEFIQKLPDKVQTQGPVLLHNLRLRLRLNFS
jgi:hypothetical protein